MGRIYAGVLGLLAFVTILARGWLENAVGGMTVIHAAAAMFVFALVGAIVGMLAEQAVVEAVRKKFDAEVAAFEAEQAAGPSNVA
ncbi:MAG: hypothetical protein KDA41_09325 [Planctomycetales bacterium]|nr:hypothetical protein [Planctomycetales bacterium]MCB1154970.1 hypothetical protein [bacterium]